MKALLCKEFGPAKNLKVEEMDEPILNDDEVNIKVHSAGINFPDILVVEGKYQFKPDFPFAPGAEAAGEIISVGKNVTNLIMNSKLVKKKSDIIKIVKTKYKNYYRNYEQRDLLSRNTIGTPINYVNSALFVESFFSMNERLRLIKRKYF